MLCSSYEKGRSRCLGAIGLGTFVDDASTLLGPRHAERAAGDQDHLLRKTLFCERRLCLERYLRTIFQHIVGHTIRCLPLCWRGNNTSSQSYKAEDLSAKHVRAGYAPVGSKSRCVSEEKSEATKSECDPRIDPRNIHSSGPSALITYPRLKGDPRSSQPHVLDLRPPRIRHCLMAQKLALIRPPLHSPSPHGSYTTYRIPLWRQLQKRTHTIRVAPSGR